MASLLDPYSPQETANLNAGRPLSAPADIPPIPGMDAPYTANPAGAAYQHGQQAYEQGKIALQQQQLQAQTIRDKAAAATEMQAYANNPAFSGKAYSDLTPEQRTQIHGKHSAQVIPEIPGMFNQAQSMATGRPVGANLQPGETGSGTVGGVKIEGIMPASREGQSGALSEQDQQMANAVANYQYPYQALQSMARKQPGRYEQILNAVTATKLGFDAAQYQARQGLLKSFASGPDASNRTSANTLIGHLDQFLQAGQKLDNSKFTPWNAVANEVQSLTGNPNQVTFKETADAVATELSKLFKGTGAASDSEIKEWRQNLSPNASPEQIKASAVTALGLMQSRLDALKDKYRTGMGEEPPAAMLNPQSVSILQKHGLYTPEETQGAQGPTGAQPQLSAQDQQAIQWAAANPQDPRAVRIRQLHGQ